MIKIYDNEGETFDRYTVIIGRSTYTMSHNPLSPQGFNQYGGTVEDIHPDYYTGIEVSIDRVPKDVNEAIRRRRS